jgi:hypothetical protein
MKSITSTVKYITKCFVIVFKSFDEDFKLFDVVFMHYFSLSIALFAVFTGFPAFQKM